MHDPVVATLPASPRTIQQSLQCSSSSRQEVVVAHADNKKNNGSTTQRYHQHLLLPSSSLSSKQKICVSNSTTSTSSIGILKQLLHDQHEINLDLDSILQEEQLLTSLLRNVYARKDHLKREQNPLLALGEDMLEIITRYLDPKNLCRAEATCRTLQRSATTAWEMLDEKKGRDCALPPSSLLQEQQQSLRQRSVVNKDVVGETPKERVQYWYLASQRAKQWERLAPSHSCQLHHFGCRGCSEYPDHLDTQPLHNVEAYTFFLRLSHHGQVVYEDFVEVEHEDGTGIYDDEEEGDHEHADWDEQGDDEMMSWMPYHPKINLPNILLSHWDAWNAVNRSWTSCNPCTSAYSISSSLEKDMGHLLSGLAVTLIALPKVAGTTSATSTATATGRACRSSPRLVVSTVGNKNLMEPMVESNNKNVGGELQYQHRPSYLDIPLEASRMASHFVDSADHARNFMSELQVDLVISSSSSSSRGGGATSPAEPSLALQFPDILVYDSRSNYYGVAF